jgi:hypothetical protein
VPQLLGFLVELFVGGVDEIVQDLNEAHRVVDFGVSAPIACGNARGCLIDHRASLSGKPVKTPVSNLRWDRCEEIRCWFPLDVMEDRR